MKLTPILTHKQKVKKFNKYYKNQLIQWVNRYSLSEQEIMLESWLDGHTQGMYDMEKFYDDKLQKYLDSKGI